MARLEVVITTRSPLSLGTTKGYGGTLIESGSYITGGHLRGALGALSPYLRTEEREKINEILDGLSFPNCYLSDSRPSYPAPLTAQTCKREGGFKNVLREKKPKHGVADTLLMQLAYDRVARDGDRRRIPLPFQYRCPTCGGRAETYNGLVEPRGGKSYSPAVAHMHRQTRVAINRRRLTAEDGQLYSVQAFDERSRFIGEMEAEGTLLAAAKDWLPRIERLGGRLSRGFGLARVEVKDSRTASSGRERCERFNEEYRRIETELASIARPAPSLPRRQLFTVNLRSDLLLRTEEGAPTLRLDEDLLRDASRRLIAEADFDRLGVKLIAQYAQPRWLGGWHTGRRLPKEAQLTVRGGGLYVFAAEIDDKDSRREELFSLLERLEASGLGEGRADGLGRIVICDQFHLEVTPV